MAILRYRPWRRNQGPAKPGPAARNVFNVMVADLTQSLMAEMDRAPLGAHLSGDRGRPIGFADIAALPEPEWAAVPPPEPFRPGRYEVDALVPAGQLAAVALDDGLTARLDAMAAVWCDAMFDDGDEGEGEAAS